MTNPAYAQNDVYQSFVEDPQGPSNVVNFRPNFIPFKVGSNLTVLLKHNPTVRLERNHRASTLYLLTAEKGKQVPDSDSVYPSVAPYPVF